MVKLSDTTIGEEKNEILPEPTPAFNILVPQDRNKAAFKLRGFGPVYCINLDGQPERWRYMEAQFKYWEMKDYHRISAYDGRADDLSDILKGRYPDNMTGGEIGCTTSHLKAIKHWMETSDSPYAVFMEDDCALDLAQCWNFTWQDAVAKLPYDWDVVQIAIICTGDLHIKIHKRFVNEFSTACYIMTRHHAEKMMKLHCRGDKYKLDNGVRPRPVADDLLYNSGNTYSIPLLSYKIELGSSIHPDHIGVFHQGNRDAIENFWTTNGSKFGIDELMDLNPYLGRTIESSSTPKPEDSGIPDGTPQE